MDGGRLRTILGIAVGVLVVAGFGLGRVLGGVGDLGGTPASSCAAPISWDDAADAVGEHAAVAGPVAAVNHEPDVGGGPTFVNLGNPHPEPERFDVVIYEDIRERFEQPPERTLADQDVCVRGHVRDRDGVPQIVLERPGALEPQ